MQAANEAKAKVVYDAIFGSSGFYASPVAEAARSLMNIPFTIPSRPELEKDFVAEASKRGMVRAGCASRSSPLRFLKPVTTRLAHAHRLGQDSSCLKLLLVALVNCHGHQQHRCSCIFDPACRVERIVL